VPDALGTPQDPGGLGDFSQLGYRVPSTIISPWTRHHQVDHTVYEHTSYMRFVSENWGLPYLTKRAASTNSLEAAFRGFKSFNPDVTFQPYTVPLDAAITNLLDANLGALAAGKVPPLLPVSLPKSDMHLLAETGWFDHLKVNIDHKFEDGFLSPSTIRKLLPR
jgi:hypothetical protein